MKALLLVLAACGAAVPRDLDSTPAVTLLQTSKFDEAGRAAAAILRDDPRDARAAAVRAITTYRAAGDAFVRQLVEVIAQGERFEMLDHAKGRQIWAELLAKLEEVDRDLALVAADPSFALELCLACWEHDWNRSGEIDARDRKLFEIELDGKGGVLADRDPRRRPTYRFDVGDAEWARAMIAFQRAAIELVLAYQWSDLDKLFRGEHRIVIRIAARRRVQRARTLVLAGLAAADRCRAAYLAEVDDDREWVPNPRQRSYAMPLEVDARLYDTWHAVIGDVRRMLESEEGISLQEAVAILGVEESLPDIYIDLGAMLREPRDIIYDPKARDLAQIARNLLGAGYRTTMKPSPITRRLRQMKDELSRGEDTFERKLRYLLWLN